MRYFIGQPWIRPHLDVRRWWSDCYCLVSWTCVLVCAMASYAGTDVAKAQNSQLDSDQTLQEVTVTAHRQIDDRKLDRVIIPRFVASHGAPNPKIKPGRALDSLPPRLPEHNGTQAGLC
jgi:hypothetical protein